MSFEIRHDVGVGDFLQVESYWPFEEKAQLRAVHHAWIDSPGSRALRSIMDACPTFRDVRHLRLAYPTEQPEGAYSTLRDQGILHRLPFVGSAFLAHPLACGELPDLPREFVYVLPSTPFNAADVQASRNMRGEEWGGVIDWLEARGATGLVVNAAGGMAPPDHPRLLDLTGKTSLPQSIEILKRASGYIGIDSCMAILAAQLFKPDDLLIRTTNQHIVESPWLYYSPQSDFSFLVPRFGSAPHPVAPRPAPGVVVELRCNALVGVRSYTSGDRVDVHPERAARMLESGQAVECEQPSWPGPS